MFSNELLLVNAKHPMTSEISSDMMVEIGHPGSRILLNRNAAALLKKLIRDIHAEHAIIPVSGWRSFREQTKIWNETVDTKGADFARQFVARPGCSEHHTGLAVDLAQSDEQIDFICPNFPYSGICQVFREKAPLYGFIERYPAGKEQITGIAHEPWHFRYVGIPHAEIMFKEHLVLEEYLEKLRDTFNSGEVLAYDTERYSFVISYSPSLNEPEQTMYGRIISEDNRGGCVITSWEERVGR